MPFSDFNASVSHLVILSCTLRFCVSGIERLLLLLGEKPSSPSPSEGAACERVQQKAAVTLARLSRDPDVAQTAIQLKGATAFLVFSNTMTVLYLLKTFLFVSF